MNAELPIKPPTESELRQWSFLRAGGDVDGGGMSLVRFSQITQFIMREKESEIK